MIHAQGVKAVQELLVERGIEPKEGERWGDYVARGLDVSDAQAEAFLEALDQDRTVEEACAIAAIPEAGRSSSLVELGRSIGMALARLRGSR